MEQEKILKEKKDEKKQIIIGIVVGLFIVAIIFIILILNQQKQANKAHAKSLTLSYIDSIEEYVGFAEAQVSGYNVLPPGKTICTKESKYSDWEGTEDDCYEFMNAVDSKHELKTYNNELPDSATIKLSEDGIVEDGSEFEFSGYTCTYYDIDVTCE